jgi:hypothetical protein
VASRLEDDIRAVFFFAHFSFQMPVKPTYEAFVHGKNRSVARGERPRRKYATNLSHRIADTFRSAPVRSPRRCLQRNKAIWIIAISDWSS